jgi:hypothetical protein
MDKEKDSVMGMLKTFKLWVFSWMCMDGVESEEEYLHSRKRLELWLSDFSHKKDKCLSYNANMIMVFLTKKLDPLKTRWFFPGRQGRMTLDQKSTSSLESQHRVMKSKKGISVSPNMRMHASLLVQDQQADRRMMEYQVKTV